MTAALLNTHLRDNMKVGRGYARAIRTGGNVTCNSTAWANTSTAMDLTLAATTGDVIECSHTGFWSNEAVNVAMNATMVTGGAGFSTLSANTSNGVVGWFGITGANSNFGGTVSRTAVTADISGGNVIVRVRHRTLTAANKTLNASTASPFIRHVRNVGPNVAP